jgi:hypothetical protein
VAGRSWDLWVGYNGAMRVFSFIAPSPVTSFNANVADFFSYLTKNQNYPASTQNLIGMFTPFDRYYQDQAEVPILLSLLNDANGESPLQSINSVPRRLPAAQRP